MLKNASDIHARFRADISAAFFRLEGAWEARNIDFGYGVQIADGDAVSYVTVRAEVYDEDGAYVGDYFHRYEAQDASDIIVQGIRAVMLNRLGSPENDPQQWL